MGRLIETAATLLWKWAHIIFLVTLLLFIGVSFGLARAQTETDIEKLWMWRQGRLVEELDDFKDTWGGLGHAIMLIFSAKDGTDANIMDTATLRKIESLQAAINNVTNDPTGMKATHTHSASLTVEHGGVKYGLRELCLEPEATVFPFRVPCSSLSVMYCFKEGQHIDLPEEAMATVKAAGDGWDKRHRYSLQAAEEAEDGGTEILGKALSGTCYLWTGSVKQPQTLMVGGETRTEKGHFSAVSSLALVYSLTSPTSLVAKMKYVKQKAEDNGIADFKNYPDITTEEANDILLNWAAAVADFFSDFNDKDDRLKVDWINAVAIQDVIDKAGGSNRLFLLYSIVLMMLYIVLSLSRCNLVMSHILLGFGSIICVIIAVISAMGFASLVGIPFNLVTLQILPFLAFGLGIDDSFVVIYAFDFSATHLSIRTRLVDTFYKVIPSISLTSASNFVAFLLSLIIPIPVIRWFALDAAIAVVFNYIAVLLLFTPLILLDAKRIDSSRYDVVPCLKRQKDTAESSKETEKPPPTPTEEHTIQPLRPPHPTIVKLLSSWIFRIVVLVVFSALLAVAAWGCTKVKVGLEWDDFTTEGTVAHDFLVAREEFGLDEESAWLCVRETDFSVPQNQKDLTKLLDDMLALSTVQDDSPIGGWWDAFKGWCAEESIRDIECWDFYDDTIPQDQFYPCLNWWMEHNLGQAFKDNFIVETDSESGEITKIAATRYLVLVSPILLTDQVMDMMEETRNLIDNSPLDSYLIGFTFLYFEQYFHIIKMSFILIAVAVVAIAIVGLIFLRNIVVTIAQLLVLISMCIFTVCIMPVLDIPLNSVALVNIIFGIGLFVEYTAHLCRSFMFGKELGSATEQAAFAITDVFLPVVHGAFTSFFAVLVIAFSDTRFFVMYFFGMYSLMIFVGLLHGLVLLPVLLSFTPKWCLGSRNKKKSDQQATPPSDEPRVVTPSNDNGFQQTNPQDKERGSEEGMTPVLPVDPGYPAANSP
eukprot:TRINITY_DN44444_c0_g1_i1.p1 TRINITY_DN44444_c0_g1~~TRINITY_DN44444_c0_g1_i1.p1  ORF type:complete len:988 (-),score=87.19 TRINITY_DN44444_c0_g1_i1:94-3057(-)